MAPQLQINQGPQDALLFDNTRSYFTNVGYTRTSNFQMELRDVDPQNTANLGATVNFVIPKAADLLGPVDLMIQFAKADSSATPGSGNYWGWVESVGLAMLEKITFSVGSHDVEVLTGEHLNIMNELMRSDTHRYGFNQVLKTGRPLVRADAGIGFDLKIHVEDTGAGYDSTAKPTVTIVGGGGAATAEAVVGAANTSDAGKLTAVNIQGTKKFTSLPKVIISGGGSGVTTDAVVIPYLVGQHGTMQLWHDDLADASSYDRIIAHDSQVKDGKKLIIPLGLFFTTHPSKYFPLAAIAGCNDVRISIKFRTLQELVMCHGKYGANADGSINASAKAGDAKLNTLKFPNGNAFDSKGCYLRCHYIHVTGPEATALMNREHVRLMKLWDGNHVPKQFGVTCKKDGHQSTLDIDLSFLHPVQELVITIRKVSEFGSSITNNVAIGTSGVAAANHGQTKNYFAYHGGGKDPNIESWPNCVDELANEASKPTYLKTKSFTLKLNGQTRHLDGQGIDREYLMNRLMPMLHSNTGEQYAQIFDSSLSSGVGKLNSESVPDPASDFAALSQLKDRKEIYVYPFALNPEGANPSGSVNFSKVSHAKLQIAVEGFAPSAASASTSFTEDFQVDVYGVYYNWLAIKDGRALTSFA